MTPFGKALKQGTLKRTQANYDEVAAAENDIAAAVDAV